MIEDPSSAAGLRKALNNILSNRVRPFLRTRGFTKSGRTFRREREPLYDVINFQGSKWNGVTPSHTFFVNVGIGSTEMDAVHVEWPDRTPLREYVLDKRWERLVPDLPWETSFDAGTNVDMFADKLIDDLDRVVTVIDAIDTSSALARWAADHNLLNHMEKTCHYLVATGDADGLTRYVTALRDGFRDNPRWEYLNRTLVEITGHYAAGMIGGGLLDPDGASPI